MEYFHRQNAVRHGKLLIVAAVVSTFIFYATCDWAVYFLETYGNNVTSTETAAGLLQVSSSSKTIINGTSTYLTTNTNTVMTLNGTSSTIPVITDVNTVLPSSTTTLSTVGKTVKFMTSLMTTGRLGNMMGSHATLLGLAQMNGYKAVMEKYMLDGMGQYFDFSTPLMDEEIKKQNWTIISPTDYMQEQYRHLNDNYIQVYNYVNSWTFFHHIKPVIVKEFAFKKVLKDEAQKILHEISNKMQRNVTFVGIHVRRGDKIEIMANQWKGVIGDKKYIEKAMGIFRDRYNNSVFVVISDDKEWCRNNLNNSTGDVFIPGAESSPGQDLATLVACNHTIMTIGTFGFWASYLCGGDVIYLANYTIPNSALLNIIRHNSSYLPEWLGLPADLSPLYATTATTQTTILSTLKSAT